MIILKLLLVLFFALVAFLVYIGGMLLFFMLTMPSGSSIRLRTDIKESNPFLFENKLQSENKDNK